MNKSRPPRFTIRLANLPGDDQLIADLFLKFPPVQPRRSLGLPIEETETFLFFDENQDLVGTYELAIAQNLRDQQYRLGETVTPDIHKVDIFPKLILLNFCFASAQVEEFMHFFSVLTAHEVPFKGENVTEILRLHSDPKANVPDSRQRGYVSSRVSGHHPEHRVAISLFRAAFLPTLKQAATRFHKGEIPKHHWEGLRPFRQRYPK